MRISRTRRRGLRGANIDVVSAETLERHKLAYPERPSNGHALPAGGKYQVRSDGESHAYDPQTVHALQTAVRRADFAAFQKYSAGVNAKERRMNTLRGLLRFKDQPSIPVEEVEPVEAIMSRFKTGAMSYGSISMEAHTSLAIAMNRIGGSSNTGEGGEARWRFQPLNGNADQTDLQSDHIIELLQNGDSAKSKIKQVASGRFGVTSEYLVNAEEIQIKMAQGRETR